MAFGVATLHVDSAEGRSRDVSPGNLELGFRAIGERHGLRYATGHIGFRFALPTSFQHTDAHVSALEYALAVRGGWDPWAWEPGSLGIVVPAGFRAEVLPRLEVATDGAVAGLFAASSSQRAPAFAAQVGGEIRYALPWFGVGVRAQGVYNGRSERDRTQASAGPLVDTHLCRRTAARRIQGVAGDANPECPLRLAARLTVNLDRPYGFASEDALRVWGLLLSLGWAVW
jgi:hypothetical protein